MDPRVEANRRRWDERVPIHVRSRFYDVEGWKAGRTPHLVAPYETDEIGDVTGMRLCHLQCHFGMDTLTFARRGAEVVGVDFSAPAIEQARALARDVGLDATFVQSTVEDARAHLEGDFDIVYTSWGALIWLGDLDAWARTIASLLRPAGFLYVAEQHPMTSTYGGSYFRDEPFCDGDTGTYADVTAQSSTTRPTSGTTRWARSSPPSPGPACASRSCTSTRCWCGGTPPRWSRRTMACGGSRATRCPSRSA